MTKAASHHCFSAHGIPFYSTTGMTVGGGDMFGANIIAASPFIKQPATMNFRVVLRWDEEKQEFIVHDQFENDGKTWFEHGDYYRYEKTLPEALTRFAERVLKQARQSESCFRDRKVA